MVYCNCCGSWKLIRIGTLRVPDRCMNDILLLLDFRGVLIQVADPDLIKSLAEEAASLGLDELE